MFDKDGIVLKPLLDEDIPLFDRWLSKDYIYKWAVPGWGRTKRGLAG